MPTQNSLLTIKDAANFLRVSEKTLRRWEESGRLLSIRTSGGHRRYQLEALKEFKKNKSKKQANTTTPPSVTLFNTPQLTFRVPDQNNAIFPQIDKRLVNNNMQSASAQKAARKDASNLALKLTPAFTVYKKRFTLAAIVLVFIVGLIAIASPQTLRKVSEDIIASVAAVLGNKVDQDKTELGKLKEQLEENANGEDKKVLAATSFSNLSFNVNTESVFKENSEFAKDINVLGNMLIGTRGPSNADLTGGDLYVSDELEVESDAIVGSLTLGGENFVDLTGTGLTNVGGVLQTSVGTSIESSEITDGAIAEIDLNVSNTPSNAQVLTYNSTTGAFSWTSDQTGAGSLFTDGGSITYLTSTTDDFALGGSISSSPFFFDVSAGNLTLDSLTTDSGGITIATGQDLTIGTIGLNDVGASNVTSGASLVGIFDEFSSSSAGTVQDVLDDLDAAIGSGASKWTQDTGFIYLTNTTDSVTVGGVTELGKLAVDGNADEVQLLVQGNGTQTSNLVVFENSAGTDQLVLTNAGNLTIAGDLAITGGNITTAVTTDLTLTATGTFTANGQVDLGDNGDTVAINSSDWDISIAGDLTNIGSIGADGDITLTQATPSMFLVDNTAASDDYSINIDGSTFSIVNDTDVRTDISISGAGVITLTGNTDATNGLDVTGANLTVGGAQFSVDVSNGNVTSAGDVAINGGDITSSGDLTLTLTGGDLFLANTNTFNVGGNATDVAYNVIGDTTTGAGSVDSDDDLYVEGNLEVDGSIFGGGVDITSFVCPDCIDFDDMEDTLDLDGALIVNQGTSTWTQNFTGLATTGLTYNANSLTTGSALNVTASSNPGAVGPVSPIQFNLTSINSATATTFNAVDIGFTSNPGIAGNTEYIVQIQNEVTSNTTDNLVTALIRLDNADTSSAGSTVATNGLLITNSGDIAGGITNAINIDDTDITTDIVLQNDETIDNNTDGTITLTSPTTSLSGDLTINGGNITTAITFDSTLAVTGAFSANEASTFSPNSTNDITFNVDTDSLFTLDSTVANGDNIIISPNNAGTGSTFTATISTSNLTADRSINIPDAAGDVCLSSGNCAGGAGGSKWTDSGSTIYLTDTGDELVLGGSSPLSSSKFSIDGDADQIQFTIQGNVTQTSNLFVVENSSGTDFFAIEDLGGLNISPSSTDDITFTTDSDSTIAITGLSSTSGTALCLDGSNNVVTCSAGSGSSTLQSAYDADTNGSDTLITLSANDDSILFRNPASSGTDSAFNFEVENLATGLTTANFKNFFSSSSGTLNTTSTSLTNYAGYFTNTSTESAGANTLTNIGLYATASGGDTNYSGIFEAGNFGVGDTTPASLFTVGAADVFQIDSSGHIVAIGGAAHSITNSSGSLLINSATTGTLSIGSDSSNETLNFGTGTAVKTVVVGSTNTTSATTIQSGTGDITFASQDDFIFSPIDGSEIDITAVASTTLEGVIDLNVDTSVTGGFEIINQGLTVNSGATGGDDFTASLITLTSNDADADVFGIQINSAATLNAAAGSYEALIRLDNAENTVGAVTDGILITSSSGTDQDITDAIDVSHTNIVNAINVGANVILGTTGDINLSNFDVTGSSGDITTSGDIAINGGDITTSGDLTVSPAGGDLFLSNATTLNIGGNATDVAYNIIGDNNTGASGSVDSDDDLYIEGFIEVDGGIILSPASTNDTSIVTDSDSTLNITGLSASTGSALCLDGSSNVVTCTVGAGGISGSGTAGQIAFFDTSTSISSEASGFGWDSTNNLLTVVGLTTATTSTVESITSSANTLTSGGLISAALTSSSATAAFTGDIGAFSSSRTNATAAQTLTDTSNILDLSRTTITNNGTATTNVTGAILSVSNTATQTLGTLSDSANLVSITQDADATGALVYLNTNRSSTGTSLLVEQSAGGTDVLLLQDNGNLTIGGDLAISGGNITTAVTFDSTATATGTLTANGTFAANGIVTLGDGGDTITITGSDTNIAVLDGSTINIDGDTSPTTDILQVGSGDTSVTDGVDALQLTFGVSAASGNIIDITPSYADATAGATNENYYIIDVDAFTATQNALGDTGDISALNVGNLTQTETAGTIDADAIQIGTGWDSILDYNGTTVINGSGQVVSTQITGTLFSITGGATETIVQGNTITFGDTTTIGLTVAATDTVTADVNANSLDFTQLEPSLDVDTATDINLGANALTIDLDSTGDFSIRDVTTDIATFADSGAITFDPTDGQALTANLGAGSSFSVIDSAAPTTDFVSIISDAGTTTANANALQIDFTTGDGASVTNSGLEINMASGGTISGDIINAINLTMDALDSSTQKGLNFADNNFDTDINASTDLTLGIGGTNEVILNATDLSPSTSDGSALGTSLLFWSDLFLASGGVINFNSDVTLTHSSDTLTLAGGNLAIGTNTLSGGAAVIDFTSFDVSSTGVITTSTGASNAISLTRSSAGQWIGFSDGVDIWGLYNTAGSPEGVLAANTGALSMDTTNGTLYVKTDDTDNTGWVNLATGASSPFTASGGIIDKTDAADRLRLLYGDAADTQFTIENTTNNVIPTVDSAVIDLTGNTTGIVTGGVDALSIALEAGNIAADGTISGLHVAFTPITGGGAGDIFNGITIDGITATGATENAINISTGWDTQIALSTSISSEALDLTTVSGVRTVAAIDLNENNTTGTVPTIQWDSAETRGGLLDANLTGALGTENFIDLTASAAFTSNLIDINTSSTSSGNIIDITTATSATSGNFIDLNFGAVADTGDAINVALGATATGAQALVVTSGAMTRTTDLFSIIDSGTSSGDAIELQLSGATTGNGLFLNNDAMVATGHVLYIDSDADRSSTSLFVIDDVADVTASAPTIDINMTGITDESVLNFDLSAAFTGNVIDINSTSTGSGNGLDVTFSSAAATGNAIDLNMGTNVAGDAINIDTAATTGQALDITGSAVFTGNLIDINATGAVATGNILDISSTSTGLTTGRLVNLDWSPGSATTATGDLFRLNIGTNGNVGNLFNVTDTGSSLFSISESQITSALPHSFTAAGDVNIAYDLVFTNQTASTIDSYGPLTIRAGESFENNNLTLAVWNAGGVIVDGSTDVNSSTGGVLDINVNSTTTANIGLNIDYTADSGVTAAADQFAGVINLQQNDADGDLFGLLINTNATSATLSGTNYVECMFCLENDENTAAAVADAIRISSTAATAGSITVGLDFDTTDITDDIELQNGETINNDTDGTVLIEDGGATTLISSSTTTTSINLSAQVGGTAQRLCHDGADAATGVQQVGDCGATQADLAEYYGVIDGAQPGDIVVASGEASEINYYGGETTVANVIKSSSGSQNAIIGVVSTNPSGEVLGDAARPYLQDPKAIALVGRTPVKVTSQNGSIDVGDSITSSIVSGAGMKATQPGFIVGKALSSYSNSDPNAVGTIIIFVNPSWYEPMQFTATGDVDGVNLAVDPNNPEFTLLTGPEGNVVNKLSGIMSFIAENIKAGYLEVNQLVSKSVRTNEIVINNVNVTAEEANMAKLLFKNTKGEEVASIDEQGNASFSGKLTADSLQTTSLDSSQLAVDGNATIAGELRADRIVANEIVGLDAKLADLEANRIQGITREEIEELLNEAESDQDLISQSQAWTPGASGSGSLNELVLENLYVTGSAAMTSLSLSQSLVVGSDLVFSSLNSTFDIPYSSIDTISAPLSIQSSASQPLYLMAGLVQIDTSGNVQIAGDLAVGGAISASGLNLQPSESGFAKLLALQDSAGNEVASIDASGSAKFKNVLADSFEIVNDPTATSSATFTGLIYETASSAGSAIVAAGSSETAIINPNIGQNSLIFVTPKSSTGSYTLFVKSQEEGQAKIGFTETTDQEIEFNWWIVGVAN